MESAETAAVRILKSVLSIMLNLNIVFPNLPTRSFSITMTQDMPNASHEASPLRITRVRSILICMFGGPFSSRICLGVLRVTYWPHFSPSCEWSTKGIEPSDVFHSSVQIHGATTAWGAILIFEAENDAMLPSGPSVSGAQGNVETFQKLARSQTCVPLRDHGMSHGNFYTRT